MNPIAIYSGSLVIYWSAVIIMLGVFAAFCLSYAVYTANGGSGAALWALLPIAVPLSVFFSRLIHWYCHLEQYAGFLAAMTDFSVGSYSLPGMLLGVALAALIVRRIGLADSVAELLDGIAPGMALCIAVIRLSALFNSTCRSKIIISTPALQHLPLASELSSASGAAEYRFATFFVEFLIMLVITALLLNFYFKRRNIPMKDGSRPAGNTAAMLLLFYSAVELVLDSTRYDSSFFHFTFIKGLNPYAGFISLVQLISAVCILCVLIRYSKISVRANTLRWYHFALWAGFVACLAGVGVSEYMVQRHGDWYLGCYSVMSLCCLLIALVVYGMYLSGCVNARRPAR